MSNIGAVIGWKHNHQAGMSTRDGVITEFPGGIPSQADQDTWTAEYEAHVAATAYRDDRRSSYPSLGDQLDAIWKELNYRRLRGEDLVQDADDMLGAVLAVKSAHPKPEE